MAKLLFLLVFGALVLHVNSLQFGAMPEFLHSNYEHNHNVRRPQIISREREVYDEREPRVTSHLHRNRRDTVPIGQIDEDSSRPDIKPKVSRLLHAYIFIINCPASSRSVVN